MRAQKRQHRRLMRYANWVVQQNEEKAREEVRSRRRYHDDWSPDLPWIEHTEHSPHYVPVYHTGIHRIVYVEGAYDGY